MSVEKITRGLGFHSAPQLKIFTLPFPRVVPMVSKINAVEYSARSASPGSDE